jgi:Uma2 family endonuclease
MNANLEPVRHRLTIDDYERLGEAGAFPPDSRVELIDGDLIDMPPIGTGHASVTNRLIRLLVLRVGDRAIVSPGNPMLLPPWSMPQPDLMLLRPRRDEYARRHPAADDVLLAIEVGDSSLHFDLGEKARVYAAEGIAEYWVVEVDTHRLHVHRDPSGAAWNDVRALEAPFSIAPLALAGLTLHSEELWPDIAR